MMSLSPSRWAAWTAGLLLASQTFAAPPPKAAEVAKGMEERNVRAHLEFISADALQGRYTPSPGLEAAANYIGSHLKQWGVEPAGEKGTYYQTFLAPGPDNRQVPVRNVIGMVPGSDPQLRQEMVVLTAHYDHIGTASQGEDRIFNGADDNGSGTVALMEMARSFAAGPRPRRSILFIWVAGEERGLWGSAHFVRNPTVPLASLTAAINLDMIGRSYTPDMGESVKPNMSGAHEIFVIGAKKMSDDLAALVEEANRRFLRLDYNAKFDDPNDPMRLFYRSDHIEFARKGVPAVFFFDGLHPDYHQVTDEVQTIDFEKLMKVARTVAVTAWMIADRPQRVRVDRPLPERDRG